MKFIKIILLIALSTKSMAEKISDKKKVTGQTSPFYVSVGLANAIISNVGHGANLKLAVHRQAYEYLYLSTSGNYATTFDSGVYGSIGIGLELHNPKSKALLSPYAGIYTGLAYSKHNDNSTQIGLGKGIGFGFEGGSQEIRIRLGSRYETLNNKGREVLSLGELSILFQL
jgi:hypothetical protein